MALCGGCSAASQASRGGPWGLRNWFTIGLEDCPDEQELAVSSRRDESMKYVARIIPLLILVAVIKKSCRMAAHHRAHRGDRAELDGATL